MKQLLSLIICAAFVGCTTTELNSFTSVAGPIADAATAAASAEMGLPPGSAVVIDAARNSLYGAAVQKWAKQPAAQGAVSPAIGAAIQSKLPPTASDTQAAKLLEAAAAILPPSTQGLAK